MEKPSLDRDMLVKLFELPNSPQAPSLPDDQGILIRRALVPEEYVVLDWVAENFHKAWVSECRSAFGHQPIRCFIATRKSMIIGFCVYDAIARGVVGPVGLHEGVRGHGIGTALLVQTLCAMRAQGYAYAIVGWVAPSAQRFFQQSVNAQIIDGDPLKGMYHDLLRGQEP